MEKYELQKLRDLPIEEVAERLGMRVVRHKCLCPFHDDHHASLSFKVSKNTFRCFVCGAHGGTIDLVMKYLNKDFKEACRWLGAPSHLPPLGEASGARIASPSTQKEPSLLCKSTQKEPHSMVNSKHIMRFNYLFNISLSMRLSPLSCTCSRDCISVCS